jgi:hypothetical protein
MNIIKRVANMTMMIWKNIWPQWLVGTQNHGGEKEHQTMMIRKNTKSWWLGRTQNHNDYEKY